MARKHLIIRRRRWSRFLEPRTLVDYSLFRCGARFPSRADATGNLQCSGNIGGKFATTAQHRGHPVSQRSPHVSHEPAITFLQENSRHSGLTIDHPIQPPRPARTGSKCAQIEERQPMPHDRILDAHAMPYPGRSTPQLLCPCFAIFHPKREAPQHMTATRLAIEEFPLCRLMSPSNLQLPIPQRGPATRKKHRRPHITKVR